MAKASHKKKPLIERDSILGLVVRLFAFLTVMILAFGIACLTNFEANGLPRKILMSMWLIVLVPVGMSVVFHELPRGNDWALGRLGIATFCRTGLPLLIVIFVDKSSGDRIGENAFGYLAFFYLIGFITSVWVSVGRLRLSGSLNGVDSAVV